MRTFRTLLIGGLLLALLAVPGGAWAQPVHPTSGIQGPQRIVNYWAASAPIVNTVSPVTLYSAIISPALLATRAQSNIRYADLTQANATPPLHIKLNGMLSTATTAVGESTIQLGVNLGGGISPAATIALINGFDPANALVQVPIQIDVWLTPIATPSATATGIGWSNQIFMHARAEWTEAAGTATVFNAATISSGTSLNIASANMLNIVWQWGTARVGGSLTIFKSLLSVGD